MQAFIHSQLHDLLPSPFLRRQQQVEDHDRLVVVGVLDEELATLRGDRRRWLKLTSTAEHPQPPRVPTSATGCSTAPRP
jgi:hypothetical protein